jgi:hypothetical protein
MRSDPSVQAGSLRYITLGNELRETRILDTMGAWDALHQTDRRCLPRNARRCTGASRMPQEFRKAAEPMPCGDSREGNVRVGSISTIQGEMT